MHPTRPGNVLAPDPETVRFFADLFSATIGDPVSVHVTTQPLVSNGDRSLIDGMNTMRDVLDENERLREALTSIRDAPSPKATFLRWLAKRALEGGK